MEQEHVESECQEEEDYVHLFDSDFVPRERSYSHEWSVTVLGSIFIVCSYLLWYCDYSHGWFRF